MDKQVFEKDYFTVSKFAEIVGITPETLRYYDRIGVFMPAQVICKGKLRHRYYSPTQITTVKMIKVLTEIGVKLKDIKKLTESRTPESVLKLLRRHVNLVVNETRFLQNVSSIIDMFDNLLSEGIGATESGFTVSEEKDKRIIWGNINDFSESSGFYSEYVCFCNSELEPKPNLSYPIGGYFETMDAFLNAPSEPTRFFSLDPNGNDIKPTSLYLIGYTRGYYGETGDLPERMAEYAKKNGLIFSGAVYNTYLFDELSVSDPAQYLLKVSAAVREIKRVQSRRPM